MKFIAVKYESKEYLINMELFRDIGKAFEFAKSVKVIRINLIDTDNAYFEKDLKCWNYEDNSELFKDIV